MKRGLTTFLLAAACMVAQIPPAAKPGVIQFQATLRSRFEAWDWFQGEANNNYAFLGNLLRLSILQSTKTYDWQIELAVPFLLGLPDDAIAPAPQNQLGLGGNYYGANHNSRNTAMAFIKQGFVRFKGETQSVKVGRFEFIDGSELVPKNATLAFLKTTRVNQRLVGPFGFTHVMRSFDGMHYVWNAPAGNVTFVGAIPTRGVFQTDGWGWVEAGLGYLSFNKPLVKNKQAAELRLFGIYYQDWRKVLKTDSRSAAARRNDMGNIRIGSFGGHFLYTASGAPGAVDFLAWGLGQTGKWGVLDHRAGAVAVEGGFQPAILPKLKPWVRGGYYYGSGDSDPNDSKHGTFFQILPTARPFARFPFFNLMNNEDINAALIVRPHKNVSFSSEMHALRLTSRTDLWYQGGGAFQPWTFGYTGRAASGARGLATLYDLSTDLRVNAHLSFNVYYGYANGKSVMRTIYPKGKNGSLGFVEMNVKY